MNEYLQVTDILLIFAATKFQVRHERGSRRNERLFLCPFKKKGSLDSHLNTTAPRGVADNAPKGIRTWKPCQRVVQFFND